MPAEKFPMSSPPSKVERIRQAGGTAETCSPNLLCSPAHRPVCYLFVRDLTTLESLVCRRRDLACASRSYVAAYTPTVEYLLAHQAVSACSLSNPELVAEALAFATNPTPWPS